MNTAVTLTAEEFTRIHNALCFAPNRGLEATVDAIREALAGAYQQEEADFDRKIAYYSRFRDDNDLEAVWSIYELPEYGFLNDHPWPGATVMTYQGHTVQIAGPTWGDLYRAADVCIRESGDFHHCFIEAFDLRNGNELRMTTGS
jgi:hypothetical protein